MGAWDKYDKEKKNKKSAWAKYDKADVVKTSFKERLTGSPTQQRDGSFKANTGVLPFMGEVGKNLYNIVTGSPDKLGQTLGQSIAVNRGDFDALNEANLRKEDLKLQLVKKINESKNAGRDITRLVDAYNNLLQGGGDTIQSLAPKSQISNKQALSEVLNVGTSALGVGALSSGKAGLAGGKAAISSFQLAKKGAMKEVVKGMTSKEIMQNLAKEIAVNTGIGYGFDVSSNLEKDKKGAAIFKPGLATAFSALGTGALGGQEAGRIQRANSAARIAAKFDVPYKVPDAGTPPVGYFKAIPERATPERSPAIELPEPGILKAGEDLRNPPVKQQPEIPKTRLEIKANAFNSKKDFITSERKLINIINDTNKATAKFGRKNVVEPLKLTDNQLGDIWEKAHATPKQQGLPPLPKETTTPKQTPKQEAPTPKFNKEGFRPVQEGEILPNGYTTKMNVSTGEQMTNAPFKDTPPASKSEVPLRTKEETFKKEADTIDEKAQFETNNDPLKVDSINLKAEGEKADKYIETFGVDKARRVALKLDGEPEGVRASAVLSKLKNKAIKDNNYELAAELAVSDARKMSSQEINLAKLEDPNSFDLAVKEISEARRSNRNTVVKLNEKSEINSISNKLRKAIGDATLDNLSIRKLAAKLICK